MFECFKKHEKEIVEHPLYSDLVQIDKYRNALTTNHDYYVKVNTALGERYITTYTTSYNNTVECNGYLYSVMGMFAMEIHYFESETKSSLFALKVSQDGNKLEFNSTEMTLEESLLAIKEVLEILKKQANEADRLKEMNEAQKQIVQENQKATIDKFYGVNNG